MAKAGGLLSPGVTGRESSRHRCRRSPRHPSGSGSRLAGVAMPTVSEKKKFPFRPANRVKAGAGSFRRGVSFLRMALEHFGFLEHFPFASKPEVCD